MLSLSSESQRSQAPTALFASIASSAAILFIALLLFVKSKYDTLDDAVSLAIHHIANHPLDEITKYVTYLGDPYIIAAIVVVVAAVLFFKKHRRSAIILVMTVIGADVIGTVLKVLIKRPRPDLWGHAEVAAGHLSYSFPSGHALAASALVACILWLVWRTTWRGMGLALGTLYIVAIGFSRVYLGEHFVTDIIASVLVSLAWTCTCVIVMRRVKKLASLA